MPRAIRRTLLAAMLPLALTLLTACPPPAECDLRSVTVTPPTLQLETGTTGTLLSQVSQSKCDAVTSTWSSANSSVATVSGGTVTAVAPGTAIISVTAAAGASSVSGSASVTVVAAPVATVAITPPSSSTLRVAETVTLTATARDARNTLLSLTGRSVVWTSSNPTVAEAAPTTGVITGRGVGTAQILVTVDGRAAAQPVTLTVTPAAVASVTIDPPPSTTLTLGTPRQFTATVRDAAGTVLTGRSIAFQSSDLNIGLITAGGLLTGVRTGTVTITATSEGATSAGLAINVVDVATTVLVTPSSLNLIIGRTPQQLTATVVDAQRVAVPGRTAQCASLDTRVATVTVGCLVTAQGVGQTSIAVRDGTNSALVTNVPVTVTAPPVQSVTLSPASYSSVSVGQSVSFVANVQTSPGVSTAVSWSSSAPNIVRADAPNPLTGAGNATAVAPGTAQICATSVVDPTVQGCATVTVTVAQTPASIAFVNPPTTGSVGVPLPMTVQVRDANGNVMQGMSVVWTLTDYGVATTGPGSGWTTCATVDGAICTPPQGRAWIVRYGTGSTYYYRGISVVQSGLPCNLQTFGGDPVPGEMKTCAYASAFTSSGSMTLRPLSRGTVGVVAILNGNGFNASISVNISGGRVTSWGCECSGTGLSLSVGQKWGALTIPYDDAGNFLSVPIQATSNNPNVATASRLAPAHFEIEGKANGTATVTFAPDSGFTGPSYPWNVTVGTGVAPASPRLGYALVNGVRIATDPAYSYNSSGGAITVGRVSAGRWRVFFAGLGRPAGGADFARVTPQKDAYCYLVSPNYGVDPSNSANAIVDVECTNYTSNGFPVDNVSFSVMFMGEGAFLGRSGFLLADQPTAAGPYVPDPNFSWNSAGVAMNATRSAPGTYRNVPGLFPRGSAPPEVPLVASVSNSVLQVCESQGVNVTGGNTASVGCQSGINAGGPFDSSYNQLIFSGGRPGTAWGFGYFYSGNAVFDILPFQNTHDLTRVSFAPIAGGGQRATLSALAGNAPFNIQIMPNFNASRNRWVSCGYGNIDRSAATVDVVCRDGNGTILASDFVVVVFR